MPRAPFNDPKDNFWRGGGQIRARDQARVYDLVQQHDRAFGTEDSAARNSAGGMQNTCVLDIPFWAKLVTRDETDAFKWLVFKEQKLDTIAEWWVEHKEGRTESSLVNIYAYEVNKETVPAGTVVLMHYRSSGLDDPIDRYVFEYQGICWARLLAVDNSTDVAKYSWEEVTYGEDGTWTTLTDGRHGDPSTNTAFSSNNFSDVPAGPDPYGAIVLLHKGWIDPPSGDPPDLDETTRQWVFEYEFYEMTVEITDRDNTGAVTKYAWKEKLKTGPNTFTDRPGGKTGSTSENYACEQNSKSDVPVGYIVHIRTAAFNSGSPKQEWIFNYELERFPVELTALNDTDAFAIKYSWKEKLIDLVTDRPSGRTGDDTSNTLYERNNLRIPIGSIVWARTGEVTDEGPPLEYDYLCDYEPARFWVRITGYNNVGATTLYSATEQIPAVGGTWTDRPGGRTFAPTDHKLYSRSNKSDIQIGHVVLVSEEFYGGSDEDREYVMDEETIEFPVLLTDVDESTHGYAWTELLWAAGGAYSVRVGGRTGTLSIRTAWERNYRIDVPIGSVVYLQASHYVGAGGGAFDDHLNNQQFNFDYETFDGCRPKYYTGDGTTIHNFPTNGYRKFKWDTTSHG